MKTAIKNCGFKESATLATAIATGANFIGLVHAQSSPRHLSIEEGSALRSHIPSSVKAVAVLVSPDDSLLETITSSWRPDIIQLHGVHDIARLKAIKSLCNLPLIVAVSVATMSDIADAARYNDIASYILFDTKSDHLDGGTGKPFDWRLLHHVRLDIPWFLAGGLTPSNVAHAIAISGARYIDVSSGIESARGQKSKELIAAFNHAVLHGVHV